MTREPHTFDFTNITAMGDAWTTRDRQAAFGIVAQRQTGDDDIEILARLVVLGILVALILMVGWA